MWPGYHIVTGSVACLINPVGSYFFNTKSVESGATDGTRCPRCAMIIVIGNSSKCSGWTNPTKTTWHGCRDIFVAAWPTWLVVQVEVGRGGCSATAQRSTGMDIYGVNVSSCTSSFEQHVCKSGTVGHVDKMRGITTTVVSRCSHCFYKAARDYVME